MQVEVGSIVEGKITGITHFGAFVSLDGGQTGMVHISEVSNAYVKEIGDYLTESQEVKVKILSIADDGKISLSMKRCEENALEKREGAPRNPAPRSSAPRENRSERPPRRVQAPYRPQPQPKDFSWDSKGDVQDVSFEDMITKFKQVSNDRISELKKANDPRRSRRSNGPK